MTVSELIEALALPGSCRVDQRVPKKMLIENAAPTAADKRLLNDYVEEIEWIAALKPNTIGVPDFRDEHREYREVAVLSIVTRDEASAGVRGKAASSKTGAVKSVNIARLAELVHRAVPYPMLLLLATPNALFVSAAHKRWAQNDAARVVLDGEVTTAEVAGDAALVPAFMQAMALTCQPQLTLMTLYQGWLNCLSALLAVPYTGTFKEWKDQEQADMRRLALRECMQLEQEARRLRAQAEKAKQMAMRVDLNLALQRVLGALASAREQLRR
jgi:hypothetical protein